MTSSEFLNYIKRLTITDFTNMFALEISNGMPIYCSNESPDDYFNFPTTSLVPEFNNCYATEGGAICLILDNDVYVTPHTKTVEAFLKSYGFSKKNFGSPICSGYYPLDQTDMFEWSRLKAFANKLKYAEFTETCIALSKGRYSIPDEILARCYEIPEEGLKLYDNINNSVRILNAALNHLCYYEDDIVKKIGTYNYDNGYVGFVARDGRTFYAYGYWILPILETAGFRKAQKTNY